jgi:ABC-type molybdate transport system permease subunit
VLGACMAGAFAFIVYTGVTAAFGENDLLSLAPVVIGVILFVVLGRRRRRSVMSERDGGRRYSFRSAVTGSTLVARRAGP